MRTLFTLAICLALNPAIAQKKFTQRVLANRSAPLLKKDGYTFKDLNRKGNVDDYDDRELPNEQCTCYLIAHKRLITNR